MSGQGRALAPQGDAARGFEIFKRAPLNCVTLPVEDGRHEPHLKEGDRAIIDPSDRTYQCGEVYAVEYSNGPSIMEARPASAKGPQSSEPCLYLHPLNRPRSKEECEAWLNDRRRQVHLSDGPMTMSYFNEIVIGRVIGVIPFGHSAPPPKAMYPQPAMKPADPRRSAATTNIGARRARSSWPMILYARPAKQSGWCCGAMRQSCKATRRRQEPFFWDRGHWQALCLACHAVTTLCEANGRPWGGVKSLISSLC